MATTQLTLFNDALALLGERSLASTSEATEAGRVVNAQWDHARKYCLEQGPWRFAERQATLSPAVSPPAAYGLTNGFAKPADFVRLNAVASDLTFDTPVTDLYERGGFWYSDAAEIHIQYVSNDATFGHDVTLWPEAFVQFFAHYLAVRSAPRINSELIAEIPQAQYNREGRLVGGGYLGTGLQNAYQAALEFNEISGPQQFLPDGNITQLSIFNNAMNLLGGRTLVKVTDATEPARVLLGLWDHVRDYCLEQGHWTFAEREAKLIPSVVEVPTFGFRNAFDHPADFIRINEVSSDEHFYSPIFNIHERGLFWYADLEEIFIRYVSKDASFGYNLNRWPESFELFVTLYLATRAAPRLAPQMKPELITAGGNVGLEQAKMNALSKDAVSGPTQFTPKGNWAMTRSTNRVRRGRNSRASLYGN